MLATLEIKKGDIKNNGGNSENHKDYIKICTLPNWKSKRNR